VLAAVVPAGDPAPELPELRRWVTDRLGAPAAPRQLHLLAAVPTLHTGKPDRRAVAALIPEV
jgi:O-succinylbenzoic acid--CoA ligase